MTTSTTDRFSAHYSERLQHRYTNPRYLGLVYLWLQYNWVEFLFTIRSRNFDTGWVLCHISMVFFQIPFKPQKGTPMMVTPPTCQVSFNSFQWFTL